MVKVSCKEKRTVLKANKGINLEQKLYLIQKRQEYLIAENNFRDMQYGTHSVYKCKLKNGGYSVCELLEGQAFMFTFYRSAR